MQRATNYSTSPSPPIKVLEPGLVLLKGALSPDEQIQVSKYAWERGADVNGKGFWMVNENGEKVLNSTNHRGRVYDALSTFSPLVSTLHERCMEQAVSIDNNLNSKPATHVIMLYYKTLLNSPKEGFILWHQDNGENDGNESYPVVSFTIGDAVDFMVAHKKPILGINNTIEDPKNLVHRIKFESGDVLVFGGPSRC